MDSPDKWELKEPKDQWVPLVSLGHLEQLDLRELKAIRDRKEHKVRLDRLEIQEMLGILVNRVLQGSQDLQE